MTTGLTQFERLTQSQIDAMAETLWDFEWNDDPNNPGCFKKAYADQAKTVKDNYRLWAQAIFLAGLEGKPRHGWFTNGWTPHRVPDTTPLEGTQK